MKLIYQGIQRIQGFKKANGEPFDMCILYVSVPIEMGAFGKTEKKTVITGYGCKPAEIEAEAACIPSFERCKVGELIEVQTDQRFVMGEFKTVVTGLARPAAISKVS